MSADQVIHCFLYQDCLIRVSDHLLVPKAGKLLLARHLLLREGAMILDRIIHESSAHLKFSRPGIVRPSLAQESGVLGAAMLFLYEHGRKNLS